MKRAFADSPLHSCAPNRIKIAREGQVATVSIFVSQKTSSLADHRKSAAAMARAREHLHRSYFRMSFRNGFLSSCYRLYVDVHHVCGTRYECRSHQHRSEERKQTTVAKIDQEAAGKAREDCPDPTCHHTEPDTR